MSMFRASIIAACCCYATLALAQAPRPAVKTPLPTVAPRPRHAAAPPAAAIPKAASTAAPPAAQTLTREIPVDDSLEAWITAEALAKLPREYVNDKRWGMTTQIMSGLDWEVDGLKVETRRRWKTVNHGTWTRAVVKLIDPEKEFHIEIEHLKTGADGAFECDLHIRVKLDCFGRMSRWNRGVQTISLSVEADATAEFVAHLVTSVKLDGTNFPPDVVVGPRVTTATLKLEKLELRNISAADGPLVHAMSGLAKDVVEDTLRNQEAKLVERINAQIEKRRDKLKLPLSKLVSSKYGDWFGPFLSGAAK
ncbi:MAG: hypothetical protein QM811_17080 [Pirellulales bacterium]